MTADGGPKETRACEDHMIHQLRYPAREGHTYPHLLPVNNGQSQCKLEFKASP